MDPRLFIYIRMSLMHQPLVAEIPSATSNKEIISIKKKLYAVLRLSLQDLISMRIWLHHLYLQKEIKTFPYQIQIILLFISSWHPCSSSPCVLTKFTQMQLRCAIFCPFRVSLISYSRTALLVIPQDSSHFPYPAHTTLEVWGN